MLCPVIPDVLFQVGHLALTTRSLPSMIAVPAYLGLCGYLSIRDGLLGRRDLALLASISIIQFALATAMLTLGGSELNVFFLTWPFLLFMLGYGAWRRLGRDPLRTWPWYRFGLLVTATMLAVDILVGLSLPSAAGRVWQLGGACLRDALVLAPPLLTLAFHVLLDCRSPWVFCSRRCEGLGRCRVSAAPGVECDPAAPAR
jgi:hypothetical protein